MRKGSMCNIDLWNRRKNIFILLEQGMTVRNTAKELNISEPDVRSGNQTIYKNAMTKIDTLSEETIGKMLHDYNFNYELSIEKCAEEAMCDKLEYNYFLAKHTTIEERCDRKLRYVGVQKKLRKIDVALTPIKKPPIDNNWCFSDDNISDDRLPAYDKQIGVKISSNTTGRAGCSFGENFI